MTKSDLIEKLTSKHYQLSVKDVEDKVAKISLIPPKPVSSDDKETLRNLENDLKRMQT